ncbi:DBF4-type zinc finger-containing protein 2 isoform X3 [Narcine bancroftii]|uniref:DBF4-type zinc finger-containing protein 2 isoform X3 n=1 Tax=Narcine bancroftii TaxID=1343680 RepID=UPI003831E374
MSDHASGSGPCSEQPTPEALPVQSKRGYCGCCQEVYTCLEQHLQSARHRQSAGEPRNPGAMKSLMDRFLQDVIQYHPSHYKDTRPTYMDMPSISAPHVPKKELADIHSYQDDQETVGTREDLPSTDSESIRSAGVRLGKDATGSQGSRAPSLPGGEPAATEEPASRGTRRTASLAAGGGTGRHGQVERRGHRLALGKRAAARGCQTPAAPSPRAGGEPRLDSGPSALRFAELRISSAAPRLRDAAGPRPPWEKTEPPAGRPGVLPSPGAGKRRRRAASRDSGEAASLSSLGSRLGCLRSGGSGSSTEWSAPLKGGCRPAANAPQPVTDARIALDDPGYQARLSTLLRSQAGAEESRAAPAEPPRRLPPSFAGMTWSEVMAEDDLRVEALVKEFKEGRYLCYFGSGRKRRRRPPLPPPATQPLAPTRGSEEPAKKAEASRCRVVKLSRGTQTSETGPPVPRRRPRGPGAPESPAPRLPSLPRSYSRILSPVQPRTLVYVLSSPVFGPAAEPASRTWPAAKVKYKRSPVRFYDPAANRIVRAPPAGLASPPHHHVRQLFRSLSPDINAGRPAEEWPRVPPRPAAGLKPKERPAPGASRVDGVQPPPLRRASPGALFGRLHVYSGPRSRRPPDGAGPARCATGYNLRGTTPATGPGPRRLRSALRRPAGRDGSPGHKVLRRGAGAGGEQGAHRRGRRQGGRRRK